MVSCFSPFAFFATCKIKTPPQKQKRKKAIVRQFVSLKYILNFINYFLFYKERAGMAELPERSTAECKTNHNKELYRTTGSVC